MAEEFQGGLLSCGENWYNLPNNLFYSSPCSIGTNDVASFDWSNHDSIISASFSSSASPDDNSNQDYFHKSGDNYSNMNNFGGDCFNSSSKQVNGNNYPLQQQTTVNSIQRLSGGLIPLDSDSYKYTSSLLQTLFDTDEPDDNYDQINIPNELMHSNNHLHFTNNEPATWTSNFLPSTQSQFLASSLGGDNKKRDFQNVLDKSKSEGVNKAGNEPAIKRARIQTPSPLPTFKVRKEKLGDRVTALQQLVSPFGKTDTASVLHEAIEYIKYLHDQVGVFSGPYLKNKSTPPQHLQTGDEVKQDLQSRGLCVGPISSIFPVTEIMTDFWTPIFGDSFK
ncbi:hypothetical protein CASFOL_028961 [Castilleja foliolosa]|uniref:BHLH domain-containing protein n=1 Tax=Castilleja foliolosa TaxID=1961234 RepID=A0ABD3CCL8_9LAMI